MLDLFKDVILAIGTRLREEREAEQELRANLERPEVQQALESALRKARALKAQGSRFADVPGGAWASPYAAESVRCHQYGIGFWVLRDARGEPSISSFRLKHPTRAKRGGPERATTNQTEPPEHDPILGALRTFREASPDDGFARAQRDALRRALLPGLGERLAPYEGEPRSERRRLAPELVPVVEAIRKRGPQFVEHLYVVLWNAIVSLQEAKRSAALEEASRRRAWTRHAHRKAWALSGTYSRELAALPEERRRVAGAERVQIIPDRDIGDGLRAVGSLRKADLAKGPPGSGRRPEFHEERYFPMRFLIHSLGLPLEPAARATSTLLRIVLGIHVDAGTLERWWRRRSEHLSS